MNKQDVYRQVAKQIDGCTQADVRTVFEVYADLVKETLKADKAASVDLPGIGKFKVRHINSRSGVSNLDGAAYTSAEKDKIVFNVSAKNKLI